MKWLCLLLVFVSASTSPLYADGYPFDPESQRVRHPSLRLKLSKDQIREVSATGVITFDEQQLRWLRHFYPATTNKADVVAATFNDNNEGLTETDVYCFWVAPDEVAVTLNEKHPKDRSPFAEPENHLFPNDDRLSKTATRQIRIGPDGMCYFRGKPLSQEEAIALIDKIASYPKLDPSQETAETHRCLLVTLAPPPTRHERSYSSASGDEKEPEEVFDALFKYAKSKEVEVWRRW